MHRQIPPASHKNSVPSGTFFVYRHEIYQTSDDAGTAIQTLQGRGLMIADTNKAEQALDAISYFRLADYWYLREESLYAQLCCIAYWLNAVDTKNTFVGELKTLLLRNPSIDPAMMGFPTNWRQEPLWQL